MTSAELIRAGGELGVSTFTEKLLARWLGEWAVGRIVVEFEGGRRLSFGSEPEPEVMVTIRERRALWRLGLSGSLGWARGFLEGEWDTPDLPLFLTVAARNLDSLEHSGAAGTPLSRIFHRLMHVMRANTRAGSRRNIAAHYDLGNTFYRLWLDPSMTYSSALFDNFSEPLASAQRRKYQRLCERLDLGSGKHVLEIGCGWGGFAEIAAREYGCRVTALTISERQAAFARERMERLGLGSQVDIRLQDYRDVDERFDAVASVEMFEAVGAQNWATYFDTLRRCLVRGGHAAVQTIVIDDAKFENYRRSADFIQRYVFPGGMLPSATRFRACASAAELTVTDTFFFGAHYAETLRRWRRAFNDAWPEVAALGFDLRFQRLWNYYLSYCEAGFAAGHTDVAHFVLANR